jgi:hypothetical protein
MILLAVGKWGRLPTKADWLAGKDFQFFPNGTYFSIRDTDHIKQTYNFSQIDFLDEDGFTVFSVEL